MKYKRGSIVEILTTNEVPYHSWRCAQIISGNKQNYTVRYNIYNGFTNQAIVECVSTKFIRPCPPLVEIKEFKVGEVVEVFHDLSWKMAIVSKVLSCDLFLVRLVGSFLEFEANKSEIRVRQSWKNDEWIVIGKVHINSNLQESHIVSARTLKRGSPYCFSQDEVTDNKFKITKNDKKRLKVVFKSPEKVDNDDCVTCSVGSCSINSYNPYNEYNKSNNDSDAESVYQDFCNESATELHKLELQAYRCTIEALHASGPLTWEKETMVTNLRMLLHISNDEHLIQLKNLISTRNSVRNR